jgi:hypothetical protein
MYFINKTAFYFSLKELSITREVLKYKFDDLVCAAYILNLVQAKPLL